MTTEDRPRRQLAWPDVTAIGLLVALVLGLGALALVCLGRWPG